MTEARALLGRVQYRLGDVAADWLGYFSSTYRRIWGIDAPLHDPCAMAIALDPSLAEAHVWLAMVHWWYDHDVDAAVDQLGDTVGGDGDAVLVVLDLSRDADAHGCS